MNPQSLPVPGVLPQILVPPPDIEPTTAQHAGPDCDPHRVIVQPKDQAAADGTPQDAEPSVADRLTSAPRQEPLLDPPVDLGHRPQATDRAIFPLPAHPAWLAFMDGYLAGITHGIGMGRAQVEQEHADAATFPDQTPRTASYAATLWAADGLSRAEWIQRRRAEHAARTHHGPSLTGEQIRENAFRSWGLIDVARWNAA